jgi:4-hydroxyphenylpyruvate dioxygenase
LNSISWAAEGGAKAHRRPVGSAGGPPPLYLNSITIRQAGTLANKFQVAGAAGYDGFELWLHEVAPDLLSEQDRREVRVRYGVHGVDVDASPEWTRELMHKHRLDVIGLCPPSHAAVQWHDRLDEGVLHSLRDTIDVAARLGARYVAMPVMGAGGTLRKTAQHLRRLAEIAADRDIVLALEPVGHVGKCSRLDEALDVLDMTDMDVAVGLLLDAFHFFRAGQQLVDLETLAADRIVAVHLCDGMDLPHETLLGYRHRDYPGTGIWDVRGFCQCLQKIGYRGHFVTEILNETYWQQDAAEVCRQAHRTSRYVLGAYSAVTDEPRANA